MGDKTKGLYAKFIVQRTDGKDEEGQKITMWVRANERANLLVVGQC